MLLPESIYNDLYQDMRLLVTPKLEKRMDISKLSIFITMYALIILPCAFVKNGGYFTRGQFGSFGIIVVWLHYLITTIPSQVVLGVNVKAKLHMLAMGVGGILGGVFIWTCLCWAAGPI